MLVYHNLMDFNHTYIHTYCIWHSRSYTILLSYYNWSQRNIFFQDFEIFKKIFFLRFWEFFFLRFWDFQKNIFFWDFEIFFFFEKNIFPKNIFLRFSFFLNFNEIRPKTLLRRPNNDCPKGQQGTVQLFPWP